MRFSRRHGNMRSVRQWNERTPAVAEMLNPAFLSVIIGAAAIDYQQRATKPLPFPLAFLVAPLVLHRDTREQLPKRVDSHMSKWVMSHEVIAAGFGDRARILVEPVREGIRFGLRTGALKLVDGDLAGNLANRRPAKIGDIALIHRKAAFVGRWLSQLDTPTTAFALLGVTP